MQLQGCKCWHLIAPSAAVLADCTGTLQLVSLQPAMQVLQHILGWQQVLRIFGFSSFSIRRKWEHSINRAQLRWHVSIMSL